MHTFLRAVSPLTQVYAFVLPSSQLANVAEEEVPSPDQVAQASGAPMPLSLMEAPVTGHPFYSQVWKSTWMCVCMCVCAPLLFTGVEEHLDECVYVHLIYIQVWKYTWMCMCAHSTF